jgi:hypothetical protein
MAAGFGGGTALFIPIILADWERSASRRCRTGIIQGLVI